MTGLGPARRERCASAFAWELYVQFQRRIKPRIPRAKARLIFVSCGGVEDLKQSRFWRFHLCVPIQGFRNVRRRWYGLSGNFALNGDFGVCISFVECTRCFKERSFDPIQTLCFGWFTNIFAWTFAIAWILSFLGNFAMEPVTETRIAREINKKKRFFFPLSVIP